MDFDSFSNWLREQLRRRRWNQADFSRATGFTTGTISRWLTGGRVPDPESCDRIADALGVDVDLVLTLAGHRPAVEPIDPNSVEAELIGLVKRVRWNDERASGIRLALTNYIELDRKKQRKGEG